MRNLVLPIAIAAAALFFSASGNAVAHAAHHEMNQQQDRSAVPDPTVRAKAAPATKFFVSASSLDAGHCPHQQPSSDCGCGCACSGHVPVALATPEIATGVLDGACTQCGPTVPYGFPHAVFDLSRPPKFFA